MSSKQHVYKQLSYKLTRVRVIESLTGVLIVTRKLGEKESLSSVGPPGTHHNKLCIVGAAV